MSLIQGKDHGKLYNNQYLAKKKISAGSFGVVFLGQNIRSKEYCAIKVEKGDVDELLSLEREVQILKQVQGVPQVPKLYWSGQENNSNVMIIQLLGHDLTYYLKVYKKFSLKCVLNIADQMLTVLEAIHKRSVLHRDIKPENILIGRDSEQQVLYLVDYGISKFYREGKGQHIVFKENKPFIGTTRYAPIAAHNGQELSRKDDLESLGYMLIYLLKGQLPWQSLQTVNEEEKIKLVGQMKIKMETNELCKDIPVEFARYMDFVKKLSFKAQPDYKYLQQLFRKLWQTSQFSQSERKFDWSDQQTTKSQDTVMKRINRRSSADPSQQLIHHVDSGLGKSKEFGQKRDNEVSSNHSAGIGPSSYLRLPDQRQSLLGSSLLSIDRSSDRHRSMASFKSVGSSLGPENSVMVGFQPSLLGTIIKQVSYSSQLSGQSKGNVESNMNLSSKKNLSQAFSNIEMSPQQFNRVQMVQLQPIHKRNKSDDPLHPAKRFLKEVTTDSKDGNFQEIPDSIYKANGMLAGDSINMKQSVSMSLRAELDLNSDEELNLDFKLDKLVKQSVQLQHYQYIQRNFKNPISRNNIVKWRTQNT